MTIPQSVDLTASLAAQAARPSRPQATRWSKAEVDQLVQGFLQRWADGKSVKTRAVIEQYPQLLDEASEVVYLASEEFLNRRQRGESLSVDQFCRQYPEFSERLRHKIEHYLATYEELQIDAPLLLEKILNAQSNAIETPRVGDVYQGFKIVEELGKGAFARVFLAQDTVLDRKAVIKVGFAFEREARVLGKLSGHPNIMDVYSTDVDDWGRTIICMPYHCRATLREITSLLRRASSRPTPAIIGARGARFLLDAIRRRNGDPLHPANDPAPRLLRQGMYVEGVLLLVLQMAQGLEHAHQQGIIHSDLKPLNVLVTSAGQVKLLDFNLAFQQGEELRGEAPTAGHGVLEEVGGTPQYMSPEQFDAFRRMSKRPKDESLTAIPPLDARSDIYSLGLILYELLLGELPCIDPQSGSSNLSCSGSGLCRRGLDAGVAQILKKCLAPRPDDRFSTAAGLACALQRQLARPARMKRRLRARAPLLAAPLVALAAVMVVLLTALQFRPPYSTRQFEQGRQAYIEQNFAQAHQHFSATIDHTQTRAEKADALIARAQSAMRMGKRLRREMGDLMKAPTGGGGDLEERNRRIFDLNRRCRSHLDLAIADIQQAYELRRQSGLLDYIIYCCAAFNDYESALATAQTVSGQRSPIALNNLGWSHFKQKDWHQALLLFNQAIDLDPDLWLARLNRAEVKRYLWREDKISSPDEVIDDLRTAMSQLQSSGPTPGDQYYYFLAARLYAAAAKHDRSHLVLAEEYLQKAIDHGFDKRQIAENGSLTELVQRSRDLEKHLRRVASLPEQSLRILNPLPDIQ